MFIRFGSKIVNIAKFKVINKVGANKIDVDEKLYELFATEKERDERFIELENTLCGTLTTEQVSVSVIDKDKVYIIDVDGQPKQKGYYYVKYQHSKGFDKDCVRYWDGTEWSYIDGEYTNFGNMSTQGEEYKLKELDTHQ